MATPEELNRFQRDLEITQEDLSNSGLEIKVLYEIYCDYLSKMDVLENHLNSLYTNLRNIMNKVPNVHSIKSRIKTPESLIKKIIIKAETNRDDYLKIDVQNYFKVVNDILGLRVVTLFKSDYKVIHEKLGNEFDSIDCSRISNIAKIPRGENKDEFISSGLNPDSEKEVSYFSIHYDYNTNGLGLRPRLEIQVRPIYIEAWAEVDHSVRYPKNSGNVILDPYFDTLGKLSLILDDLSSQAIEIFDILGAKDHKIKNLEQIIANNQEMSITDKKIVTGLLQDLNINKDSDLINEKDDHRTLIESFYQPTSENKIFGFTNPILNTSISKIDEISKDQVKIITRITPQFTINHLVHRLLTLKEIDPNFPLMLKTFIDGLNSFEENKTIYLVLKNQTFMLPLKSSKIQSYIRNIVKIEFQNQVIVNLYLEDEKIINNIESSARELIMDFFNENKYI